MRLGKRKRDLLARGGKGIQRQIEEKGPSVEEGKRYLAERNRKVSFGDGREKGLQRRGGERRSGGGRE